MPYPRNRSEARRAVLAYRRYLKTGKAARSIRQCKAISPAGLQCVLIDGHRLTQPHRDGPIFADRTQSW